MIRRIYEEIIVEHFRQERKMLLLMGPRQVGKTTTSRVVASRRRRSVYLNWDNFDHQKHIVAGPSRLAAQLGLERLEDSKPLLILDEIHKYPQWRTLLKGFFDTYSESADVLVTGSAKLGAFHRAGESLMGRYFSYRMHPLSVAELAGVAAGAGPGQREPSELGEEAFQALLRFGGFPEPFKRQSQRFSVRWQRLRYRQLFREEMRDLTRVQEMAKVQTLAQLIVQRAGQLTSYTALARGVGASIDSVKRWLALLESLYFCVAVRPWFKNVARSLRKEPKYYLWDWSTLDDEGSRFENLVASALLKAVHLWTDQGFGNFGLYFLRDKQKREVDFVVARDGAPWMLVEAKLSGQARLSGSLTYFRERLNPDFAFQVCRDVPYADADCFAASRPVIVPGRTLLSQLA